MPADPKELNPLAASRVSSLKQASDLTEPSVLSASGMRSALLALPCASRVLKSVAIAEEANVIKIFSKWGEAPGADLPAVDRQNYSDAVQALNRAENDLQESEKHYAEAFDHYSATLGTGLFVIDEGGRRDYLLTVLRPYMDNIWQMENAVDLAGEAADAAWDRLQPGADPMPAFSAMNEAGGRHLPEQELQPAAWQLQHVAETLEPYATGAQPLENALFHASHLLRCDRNLAERWQAADIAYDNALGQCDAAQEQLARATNVYQQFNRGQAEWLEREIFEANAILRAAKAQSERADHDYIHAKKLFIRELAKNGQAGATETRVPALCEAAKQRLLACQDAREEARIGVKEAVEFLHARPGHVERFMRARLDDVAAAENAVQAAQEQLNHLITTLNDLSEQIYSDGALLPVSLPTISEGWDEWESVASPTGTADSAGQAEDELGDGPAPGEQDIALAGISSPGTTAAWHAN